MIIKFKIFLNKLELLLKIIMLGFSKKNNFLYDLLNFLKNYVYLFLIYSKSI
jgi:hypothetical protein